MKSRKQQGFTLIELMITVVIIGILAAVALPNYSQYVIRSNRAAAQAEMMDIANRQQQLLLANRSYAAHDSPAWGSTGYTLPADVSSKYIYTISTGSSTSTVPEFTVTFTPKTGTPQASDGALSLTNAGVKSPAGKW